MINFKSENNGTWYYFDEDNQEAGGVCFRELATEKYEDIQRLTVKKKKKFKHGIAYDDEQVNDRLASKLRWDYCIVDWKNIQIDGNVIECTSENKQKLIKITDFVKFAADCVEKLTEENRSLEEARVKNLKPTQAGSSPSQAAKPV